MRALFFAWITWAHPKSRSFISYTSQFECLHWNHSYLILFFRYFHCILLHDLFLSLNINHLQKIKLYIAAVSGCVFFLSQMCFNMCLSQIKNGISSTEIIFPKERIDYSECMAENMFFTVDVKCLLPHEEMYINNANIIFQNVNNGKATLVQGSRSSIWELCTVLNESQNKTETHIYPTNGLNNECWCRADPNEERKKINKTTTITNEEE